MDMVDCFSGVFCRYSLGTNPRGVKDICIIYFSYYNIGYYNIVVVVVLFCCYLCMHYS